MQIQRQNIPIMGFRGINWGFRAENRGFFRPKVHKRNKRIYKEISTDVDIKKNHNRAALILPFVKKSLLIFEA
jgi:hypothetical protein